MKHKWMARQTFYLILLLALIISVPFSTIGAQNCRFGKFIVV